MSDALVLALCGAPVSVAVVAVAFVGKGWGRLGGRRHGVNNAVRRGCGSWVQWVGDTGRWVLGQGHDWKRWKNVRCRQWVGEGWGGCVGQFGGWTLGI